MARTWKDEWDVADIGKPVGKRRSVGADLKAFYDDLALDAEIEAFYAEEAAKVPA